MTAATSSIDENKLMHSKAAPTYLMKHWVLFWEIILNAFANREDLEQPAQMRRLIKDFSVCM